MKPHKGYVYRAQSIIPEIEKLTAAVKDCLEKSEGFPIYLDDLQDLVNNLVYLRVAHDAVNEERRSVFMNKPCKKK